jgi:hypothetical protein
MWHHLVPSVSAPFSSLANNSPVWKTSFQRKMVQTDQKSDARFKCYRFIDISNLFNY